MVVCLLLALVLHEVDDLVIAALLGLLHHSLIELIYQLCIVNQHGMCVVQQLLQLFVAVIELATQCVVQLHLALPQLRPESVDLLVNDVVLLREALLDLPPC